MTELVVFRTGVLVGQEMVATELLGTVLAFEGEEVDKIA